MSATFLSNVYKRFFFIFSTVFTFFNVFFLNFHLNVYYIYAVDSVHAVLSYSLTECVVVTTSERRAAAMQRAVSISVSLHCGRVV